MVSAQCYIAARGISAGRHHHGGGIPILENLIRNYPESAFLNLFRMHRSSFWVVIDVVRYKAMISSNSSAGFFHFLQRNRSFLSTLDIFQLPIYGLCI